MRLQKLTSLETGKLIEELNDLNTKIIYYKKVLESHEEQSIIIKKELEEVSSKYGDERKTEIIPISGDLSIEDMIADEDMVVTISHNGYIKRLPVSTWKTQNRGGKGMKGANTKQDDFVDTFLKLKQEAEYKCSKCGNACGFKRGKQPQVALGKCKRAPLEC